MAELELKVEPAAAVAFSPNVDLIELNVRQNAFIAVRPGTGQGTVIEMAVRGELQSRSIGFC